MSRQLVMGEFMTRSVICRVAIAFLFLALGVAAKAETPAEIVVTLPFGFVVDGKTLSAGTYIVSRLSDPANYKTSKGVVVENELRRYLARDPKLHWVQTQRGLARRH
jgi:hypothetical protein